MYICPMHPEIRQEAPGSCPKCGMLLVSENEITQQPETKEVNIISSQSEDRGLGILSWKNYMPLIVIFLILLVATVALSWRDSMIGNFEISKTIMYFMAGFFLVFAGFKLIDLKGFAEGYSMYDLLAKRLFAYGYAFPFIELLFGLLMLIGFQNQMFLWIEIVVMLFSGLGVAIKLAKREQVHCVCLGTLLKVPLTYVSIIEDFGMALLGIVLLLI